MQKTEPKIQFTLPDLPWQKVGIDLFELKKLAHLIIMNYNSRFVEITKLDSTTANAVIQQCKNICSKHGIPGEVAMNNWSQFDSCTFCRFSKAYQLHHVTSIPYYPRSNGEDE